jgi:hypothetical protein
MFVGHRFNFFVGDLCVVLSGLDIRQMGAVLSENSRLFFQQSLPSIHCQNFPKVIESLPLWGKVLGWDQGVGFSFSVPRGRQNFLFRNFLQEFFFSLVIKLYFCLADFFCKQKKYHMFYEF